MMQLMNDYRKTNKLVTKILSDIINLKLDDYVSIYSSNL